MPDTKTRGPLNEGQAVVQGLLSNDVEINEIIANSNVLKPIDSASADVQTGYERKAVESNQQEYNFYSMDKGTDPKKVTIVVHPAFYFDKNKLSTAKKKFADFIRPTDPASQDHQGSQRPSSTTPLPQDPLTNGGFDVASTHPLNDNATAADDSSKNYFHIIPEIGEGRLKGSQHIRLVTFEQKPNQTFEDAYAKRRVFDPRDFGLGAQNTFDDTNCGRYVAAMTIQAAGLAKDGLLITKENLKVSPAVRRAYEFNSVENLKEGLKFAYVKPLSSDPTLSESVKYNLAKMKCLKAEYEARQKEGRNYHGSPVFGGYSAASALTSKIGGFFKRAFTADEKLNAVNAVFMTQKDLLSESGAEELKIIQKEHPAAKQGELGKCINAILKAHALNDENLNHVQFG